MNLTEAVRTFTRRATPILAAFLLFSTAACTDKAEQAEPAEETAEMETATTTSGTVVDVAMANSNFSTLVSALQRAGLVETLQGAGPFTVFAPTNAAFAALPAGTLDNLTAEQLTNILTYHVANGRLKAADVAGMAMIPTAQGSDLSVTVGPDGSVKINDATVTMPDIEASNGVIHGIDAVLMPPSDDEL